VGTRRWLTTHALTHTHAQRRRINYKFINRPSRIGDPLIRGPTALAHNKGMFVARDDHWRKLHRVWQPVFYADSVRACAPLMEDATQRMLARLDGLAAAGQPLDIWREVGNLTMAIVGTAAYGCVRRGGGAGLVAGWLAAWLAGLGCSWLRPAAWHAAGAGAGARSAPCCGTGGRQPTCVCVSALCVPCALRRIDFHTVDADNTDTQPPVTMMGVSPLAAGSMAALEHGSSAVGLHERETGRKLIEAAKVSQADVWAAAGALVHDCECRSCCCLLRAAQAR
jgi:hypothetical protein